MSDKEVVINATELTDEALLEICRAADVLACECPGYLARILRQVRSFHNYTLSCIDQFPQDKETHLWLAAQAEAMEQLLWDTTLELMRREKLIDETSQVILLDRMSERARETALKQIGRTI